ncbi:MAG: hypothetical protein WAT79_13880 [Saprospiraceae bacterium]
MLTKEVVDEQLKEMPEQFTLDQLIERLLIVDKIQQGLKDVEEGNTLSEEEMDKVMGKWVV